MSRCCETLHNIGEKSRHSSRTSTQLVLVFLAFSMNFSSSNTITLSFFHTLNTRPTPGTLPEIVLGPQRPNHACSPRSRRASPSGHYLATVGFPPLLPGRSRRRWPRLTEERKNWMARNHGTVGIQNQHGDITRERVKESLGRKQLGGSC